MDWSHGNSRRTKTKKTGKKTNEHKVFVNKPKIMQRYTCVTRCTIQHVTCYFAALLHKCASLPAACSYVYAPIRSFTLCAPLLTKNGPQCTREKVNIVARMTYRECLPTTFTSLSKRRQTMFEMAKVESTASSVLSLLQLPPPCAQRCGRADAAAAMLWAHRCRFFNKHCFSRSSSVIVTASSSKYRELFSERNVKRREEKFAFFIVVWISKEKVVAQYSA